MPTKGTKDEIGRRSVEIKTDQGLFHKVGITCEDVDRFLEEAAKMGIQVIRSAHED